jgi:rhamnose transport system substrate-binding protein
MTDQGEIRILQDDFLKGRLSRRAFMQRAVVAGVSLSAIGAFLAACSSAATSAPTAAPATAAPATAAPASAAAGGADLSQAAKGLKIFHVPKFTGFIFFELARKGINTAASEMGGAEPTYIGADKADTQQQVQVIQNIIPQKPDVILLASLDVNAPAPMLKEARAAGCVVVTYDADVVEDARDMFTNMMTFPDQAQSMLDSALTNDPAGGKAIWMAPTPTTGNFISQKKAIDELIASKPDPYAKIQFIDTLYMNDDPEKAKKMATDAMSAHPDLKYIITGSGMATPANNQAIEDAGKQGKVWATGFGLPSTMKKYLDDGTVKMFALWSPVNLGYLACYAAVQKKAGLIKGDIGEEFSGGTLGKRTIAATHEIDLGLPLFFTKDCPDFESCTANPAQPKY